MACFKNGTIIDLAARESVSLPNMRGTTLRITRGAVWITEDYTPLQPYANHLVLVAHGLPTADHPAGDWFEKLGFATEQQVTSALGLQWGCPVVSSLDTTASAPFSWLPLAIMDANPPALYPKVPTIKSELGSNWQIAAWRVIAAPKGIPADVQRTLATALKKVYDSKDYKEFMAKQGYGTVWADPEGTAKFMAASDANLGAALKAVGLAK